MADIKVKISELNTRLTFQQPSITKDAGGAQKETYANVATNPTVWSRWIYDHGQEQVSSDADKSVQRATVTVRYRRDVLSTWQVVHEDGSIWKIISPPDHVRERNHWTELRVEQVKGTV